VYDLDFLAHPDRTWGEMRRDYPRLVRSHVAKADLVTTISDYSRGRIEALLGVPAERIAVCRPGVPSWIKGPLPDRHAATPGHILFIGTLEPRNNLGSLLAAYRLVARRVPSAPRLVLAGMVTPAAAPWVAEAQSPPLKGRVDIEGYVSSDRREQLYAGASVVVLPSLDEGFGLPVLEAMALGIPVVASTHGALPEVLGNAGLMVDPSDVDGLARAIERVITSLDTSASMRRAGLDRAREFDWAESARALLGAYARTLRRPRRSARRTAV
jgi:glycosyltransferase involved in cell wall biosynthesis